MVRVFISYSHVDEELRRQLDVHLASLRRQGVIATWHDRRITAGEDFASSIDVELARAQIILLLVSPDFIASDYCCEKEMQEGLRRHAAGEAVVIPVILRPCDWHDLPFGRLRATPTDGKPITKFTDLDSAFLEVVRDIKAAALKISGNQSQAAAETMPHSAAAARPAIRAEPRSGNLSVKKTFTDFDRDRFRADTFEYIARYFENSLDELRVRNSELKSDYRRIDATAFEAAVYDGSGKQRSRCGIWLRTGRAFGGEISYSSSGVGDRNSYNENLSVDDDGTSLGLRSMGFHSGGSQEKQLLTQEGAAEYLWTLLIDPLRR